MEVNESNQLLYKELCFIEDYIKQINELYFLDHNQTKLLMESYKNIDLLIYSLEEEGVN